MHNRTWPGRLTVLAILLFACAGPWLRAQAPAAPIAPSTPAAPIAPSTPAAPAAPGAPAASNVPAAPAAPALDPLVRTVDLRIGQQAETSLCDGSKATVKLLEVQEQRDALRDAVRQARVRVEINGQADWLDSATYSLPRLLGGVRADCPVTRGYVANSSKKNAWGLLADARIRLWPARGPLMNEGTFVYPVRQRWQASATQMANEPCYVDAGERPGQKNIYYHYGLDFGGAEHLVEVLAATDGLVVSARTDKLPGYDDTPVAPRYDVVYLLDARGWYYRYSHFARIDDSVRPGARVKAGDRLGLLGKEGGSGGWTHLHFDITCRQPSGLWGIQEAYAFAWEAYHRQYQPLLLAVARPHHVAWTGQKVVLDGSKSWSASAGPLAFDWTFTDGTTATGARIERTYARAGYYSEILKVTDPAGRTDYDFAIVHVHDKEAPKAFPPSLHVAYHPTMDLRAGQEITFKARTFGTTEGQETWDFGEGGARRTTRSDGNVKQLAPDGYAVLTHRYAQAGTYLVRVERTSGAGHTAVAHVCVTVGP